jgi:hypothetical protein
VLKKAPFELQMKCLSKFSCFIDLFSWLNA